MYNVYTMDDGLQTNCCFIIILFSFIKRKLLYCSSVLNKLHAYILYGITLYWQQTVDRVFTIKYW